MNLAGLIITWFHEVAHLELKAKDLAEGTEGVEALQGEDAIKNADSYEIFINDLLRLVPHSSNT